MSGRYVNMLAAMPSMHFGYAVCIGGTLVFHSGVLRRGDRRKSVVCSVLGVGYPGFVLVTIVATGNHYFMDALVAACVVVMAFTCNKVLCVFLPVEDWLCWVLRVEKPVPTTGRRGRERGERREVLGEVAFTSPNSAP